MGNIIRISDYLPEVNKTLYNEQMGITTGIPQLDRKLRGFRPPEVTIVAARSSMGKSSLLIDFILAASASVPVLSYSLEMSNKLVIERMLANLARISFIRMKRDELIENEKKRIEAANSELTSRPIFLNDNSGVSVAGVKNHLIELTKEVDVGCVFIDYLQLMSVGIRQGNRQQEVGEISRQLVDLVKDFNIPVVVASQLNRQADYREQTNFRPRLSDLRESGDIENNATNVLLIYRQSYYDLMNNSNAIDNGQAEIIIAKSRNGPIGIVQCNWDRETMSFSGGTRADLLGGF